MSNSSFHASYFLFEFMDALFKLFALDRIQPLALRFFTGRRTFHALISIRGDFPRLRPVPR